MPYGSIAQLAERLAVNQCVLGSSPSGAAILDSITAILKDDQYVYFSKGKGLIGQPWVL